MVKIIHFGYYEKKESFVDEEIAPPCELRGQMEVRISGSLKIRMSLIQTLSSQHKALMVSSSDLAFTAEQFGKTEVSTYPVSPKPRLILSFTLVLSILLSILISMIKNKILKKF